LLSSHYYGLLLPLAEHIIRVTASDSSLSNADSAPRAKASAAEDVSMESIRYWTKPSSSTTKRHRPFSAFSTNYYYW
jgi:hypothetical protein